MAINSKAMSKPVLKEADFFHSKVINDLENFKRISDVVVSNRMTYDISVVADKVYSCDLFGKDCAYVLAP